MEKVLEKATMIFTIYGKDKCTYCESAKKVLDIRKMEYTYLQLGEDFTVDEFTKLFPDARSFPQITAQVKGLSESNNTVYIGGFDNLMTLLTAGA